MEPLQKIFDKYTRQKEHMMTIYKTMSEDKKDEFVKLLINTVNDRHQTDEYNKLCEERFEGKGLLG